MPRASKQPAILALDFGGTKLAVGVRLPGGKEWLARERCAAPSPQGAQVVLQRMLTLADEQLGRAGAVPCAIGISFDGPIDAKIGSPRACHHVQGWEGFPLKQHLERSYRAPVALENDATVAALGEWRYGAGRGVRHMLYITVSTGVGGGLVLDGALYRGMGMAGEIGHMCLDPSGPLCPCGRRGCLEALAAGPAIVCQMGSLLSQSDAPSILRDQSDVTALDVGEAAQTGDRLATKAMRSSAQALGLAIGNALNLLHLERVILGGGVTASGPDYVAWVTAAARERAMNGIEVDIQLAGLGGEAPLWGASALAEELIETLPN